MGDIGYQILTSTAAGVDITTERVQVRTASMTCVIDANLTADVTIEPQFSVDNTNWFGVRDPDTGSIYTETLSESSIVCYSGGKGYFRLKITGGTGTINSIHALS